MLRKLLLPAIIFIFYKSLSLTWRRSTYYSEPLLEQIKNKKPFILAHWHGDELTLIEYIGPLKIATIASTSKDGEMMNTIIRWVGGKSSRGSSTRGAVGALKGLINLVKKESYNCSFAVDGPKGPIYKAKPGVLEMSKMLELPIYVAGVACDRFWLAKKSWNQAFLPKPFCKLQVCWLGPVLTVNKEQDPRDANLLIQLENALHNAKQEATKKIARHNVKC